MRSHFDLIQVGSHDHNSRSYSKTSFSVFHLACCWNFENKVFKPSPWFLLELRLALSALRSFGSKFPRLWPSAQEARGLSLSAEGSQGCLKSPQGANPWQWKIWQKSQSFSTPCPEAWRQTRISKSLKGNTKISKQRAKKLSPGARKQTRASESL